MFDFITIGTATRDAFVKTSKFKILEDERFETGKGLCFPCGSKINVEDMFFRTGGGATNTAVTFARQGFKTTSIFKIGDDISGREVLETLRREGVDVSFAVEDPKEKTAYSVLLLGEGGERTILVFRGASSNFKKEEIDWDRLSSSWVFVSGSIPEDIITESLNKKISKYVAWNPSSIHLEKGVEALREILNRVDVLILNKEEASKLTDIDFKKDKEIFKKLDQYAKRLVVMTKGSEGVVVSDGSAIYRAGIIKERVSVDHTGAGDAFGSGFITSLKDVEDISKISKEVMVKAIKRGSANATSVIEKVGAKEGIIKEEDLEDERWSNLEVKIEDVK